MFIQIAGYATATFASAEEFCNPAGRAIRPCLITDVADAGHERSRLAGPFDGEWHCTPVIFVTAYPEEGVRRRAGRRSIRFLVSHSAKNA